MCGIFLSPADFSCSEQISHSSNFSMSVFLDTNTTQAPVVTTSEVVQMSAVPSETVIKSQKTAVSNVSNVSSLVAENTKKTVTLDNLSSLVQESVLPSDQETSVYLTEVSTLKKQNLEHEMLNVLDEIIDMTVSGEIGQNDIDTEIPKTIIARIIQGDFSAEYIHSSITKKWVSHRFQQDSERYSIQEKSKTLVQVTDNALNTFDLFGLFVEHSARNRRNRISPEYIAKNEPIFPKPPRQIGSYSQFRTSQAVKKPFLPVLPNISQPHQPPQPQPALQEPPVKVSPYFYIISKCINFAGGI